MIQLQNKALIYEEIGEVFLFALDIKLVTN